MKLTHAGGIVLNDNNEIVLVLNKLKYWAFPRGHIEPNEIPLDAAIREIKEETGITELELVKDLGSYTRKRLNENKMMKSQMYLFKTTQTKLNPIDKQISDLEWVKKEEVIDALTAIGDKKFFKSNLSQI
jgi:diadenosine hexaphosphate hydrolase (ATP-forming)